MPNENTTPSNNDFDDLNNNEDNGLEYDSFSDDLDPRPENEQEQQPPSEDNVRIQVLEDELARTKEQMIRALAEAENTRKRATKDRDNASKFAISGFAKDVLSVADNLRRALDAMPAELIESQPQLKNLTDGIEATERELLRSFEKNGIKKIEPLDEMFDPNFHEVMFEAPVPEKPHGTIVQVLEPGYVLNNRILRPARVGIAKGDDTPPQSPEPGQNLNTEA